MFFRNFIYIQFLQQYLYIFEIKTSKDKSA
jgi:hypothetical protein